MVEEDEMGMVGRQGQGWSGQRREVGEAVAQMSGLELPQRYISLDMVASMRGVMRRKKCGGQETFRRSERGFCGVAREQGKKVWLTGVHPGRAGPMRT